MRSGTTIAGPPLFYLPHPSIAPVGFPSRDCCPCFVIRSILRALRRANFCTVQAESAGSVRTRGRIAFARWFTSWHFPALFVMRMDVDVGWIRYM
jgi:hypothetical protein